MIPIESLKALLEAAFPGARVTVEDLTGTSDHFDATVVSAAFEGKSRIEQHKMVYAALGARMGNEVHALALKTLTPAQDVSKA